MLQKVLKKESLQIENLQTLSRGGRIIYIKLSNKLYFIICYNIAIYNKVKFSLSNFLWLLSAFICINLLKSC